jgi:hypothetical protein
MPRRLLVINVVLGLVCLGLAVGIVRSLLIRRPLPAPSATRVAAAPAPSPAPTASEPGPETYASIAAQNLFNPGRSERATSAAVAVVKPILHGIVIEGSRSRAFLEDPSVKRVGGYSVGDTVAGGKLEKIADDRVVIARPEGLIEVLLQDPSKPRPAPTGQAVPVVAGQPRPGQPVPQPAPGQFAPVQVPPGQVVAPPPAASLGQVVVPPGAPGNQPPAIPSQSRRRVTLPGQPANE